MKRFMVSGARDYPNYEAVLRVITKLVEPGDTLIHGNASGADRMAERAICRVGPTTIIRYPADWDGLGKKAGPVRNLQMLDTNPDMVLLFHHDIGSSRGTKHVFTECKKRGLNYIFFDGEGKAVLV